MAILEQKSGLTYYQGWYGLCDGSSTECVDFPLVDGTGQAAKKIYPPIYKIYEVRGDSLGQISYDGATADGFPIHFGTQLLNKLKCGHCYRIVLYSGSDQVDIPSLTIATSDTVVQKKITNSCTTAETPTPVPQPTPTPTPEDCCGSTDFSYKIVDGQSGGDNNVTVRTQGLKSQDSTWDGTLCWEELTTNSNDTVNYLVDLRETEDSTTSLGMINMILTAKYEDQKFRYTLDSNGVCYSGEMKSTHELGQGGLNIWTPM